MGFEDEQNPEAQAREEEKGGPFRGALEGAADWAGLGDVAKGFRWQVPWRRRLAGRPKMASLPDCRGCRLAEVLCWGLVPRLQVREPVSPAG